MKLSISVILFTAFAAAQAKLQARQDEGVDMSSIPCMSECSPLLELAQQCGSTECLCSADVTTAVQACASCVQTQTDTVDPAQIAQLQSSLDSYMSLCSSAGVTESAMPSETSTDDGTTSAGVVENAESSSSIAAEISSVADEVQSSITASMTVSRTTPGASPTPSAEDPDSGAFSKSVSLVGGLMMAAFALL